MNTFIAARTAGPRFKIALLMLTSGLGCALAAGAASAATADNSVPTLVVRYNNQALATNSGVKELYGRIVSAARQVCIQESMQDLWAHERVQQCRAQAVARAVEYINNPHLAALHANSSKSG